MVGTEIGHKKDVWLVPSEVKRQSIFLLKCDFKDFMENGGHGILEYYGKSVRFFSILFFVQKKSWNSLQQNHHECVFWRGLADIQVSRGSTGFLEGREPQVYLFFFSLLWWWDRLYVHWLEKELKIKDIEEWNYVQLQAIFFLETCFVLTQTKRDTRIMCLEDLEDWR